MFAGTLTIDNGRVNGIPANLGATTNVILNSKSRFLVYDGTASGVAYTYPENFSLSGLGWGETGYNYGALRVAG